MDPSHSTWRCHDTPLADCTPARAGGASTGPSDWGLPLGQDVAEYGGVFKVTDGFDEESGKARVRNTNIIESGILGVALGLALDSKGLLLTAFEDGNPVLFLEHKLLYRSAKGAVSEGYCTVPIAQAAVVVRGGPDATIVTYGVGVSWALEAAGILGEDGREIEVLVTV